MRCLNFWDNKNFWGAKSGPLTHASAVNLKMKKSFCFLSFCNIFIFLILVHCKSFLANSIIYFDGFWFPYLENEENLKYLAQIFSKGELQEKFLLKVSTISTVLNLMKLKKDTTFINTTAIFFFKRRVNQIFVLGH